jgi:Lrp/AsnC family transcriptional regulator
VYPLIDVYNTTGVNQVIGTIQNPCIAKSLLVLLGEQLVVRGTCNNGGVERWNRPFIQYSAKCTWSKNVAVASEQLFVAHNANGKLIAGTTTVIVIDTAALADRLNSSQSPVWRRINRLEEKGVVQRRVALLDRNALGMEIVVFATVNLTQTGRQNLLAFEREVETHPEVVECYTMAGIWDYVLKIICKDVRHYEDFVRNTLLSGDLVREMHSHIAVTEIKNTTELPIATQL